MVDKDPKTVTLAANRPAFDYSKRYLGIIADDYVMVTNKKEHEDCIGIKGGRYDGIVFKFGKIASVQDPQNPGLEAVLKFQYTVVDYNGLKEEHLNIDFKNLLGDILCDIVDKHYSEGVISGTKSDDRSNDTKSVIEQ